MPWTEWVISIGLIVLVLRQLRGRRLTPVSLLWPVALVVWAGFEYLSDVPNHQSDWTFVVVLSLIGLGLGVGCGILTHVYSESRNVIARATGTAAALWIIGVAGRLLYGIVVTNGGDVVMNHLSEELQLHSGSTWTTALIVMALCEVTSRTVVLLLKYRAVDSKVKWRTAVA